MNFSFDRMTTIQIPADFWNVAKLLKETLTKLLSKLNLTKKILRMTIQVLFLCEIKKKNNKIKFYVKLIFFPGFVGVQSVPRNDIPTISLRDSIESPSNSNEIISASSTSYNSAKAYRSYVNSISATHIVDNVKIYVKNIGISHKGVLKIN